MDVFLTLDFELFLGAESGSVDKCLVEPMTRLAQTAQKHGARFTLFVDTTYLNRLKDFSHVAELRKDYDDVTGLLRKLRSEGHDLQLHIHPQWLYSEYVDRRWQIDSTHYKLSDIPFEQAQKAFEDGCRLIEEISGKRPVAFRAGGFSAQPTALLKQLMTESGINIDSSVLPGATYNSPQQQYDYTTAGCGKAYKFSEDICVEDKKGNLIELPLSMVNVSPLYYWKLAAQRLSKSNQHKRIGNGKSVKTAGASIVHRLTRFSQGFATIDESKISYFLKAYKAAKKHGDKVFCVIGHPKLATEYSLAHLDGVLKRLASDNVKFKTASDL